MDMDMDDDCYTCLYCGLEITTGPRDAHIDCKRPDLGTHTPEVGY